MEVHCGYLPYFPSEETIHNRDLPPRPTLEGPQRAVNITLGRQQCIRENTTLKIYTSL